MTDQIPAKGEFCHRHFSWLCQAGQGKCQRGDDYERPAYDPGKSLDIEPEETR